MSHASGADVEMESTGGSSAASRQRVPALPFDEGNPAQFRRLVVKVAFVVALSLLVFTLLLRPWSASGSSRKSGALNTWRDVWNAKGEKDAAGGNHKTNGFDQLDAAQWRAVVCQTGASLLPLLRPDSKILDVGCGTGRFLQTLLECGNVPQLRAENMYGVDFSAAHVRMANDKWSASDPHFFVADMTDLHMFKNEQFDIVLSFSTLFYLDSVASVQRALSEFARVAKRRTGVVFLGDVSDAAKERVAIAMREKSEYYSKAQTKLGASTLRHLYVPQSVFSQFARDRQMKVDFRDHDRLPIAFYEPAAYRFSVLLRAQ